MTKQTTLVDKELTQQIIGAFFTVYNELGYGFLESVSSNALSLELGLRDLMVRREVPVEVLYMGQAVGLYRMDQVVENKVLIEIKSSARIAVGDRRQVFNYVKASRLSVALLFHFGPKPSFERFISPRAYDAVS
jgi:GxxExxY protein